MHLPDQRMFSVNLELSPYPQKIRSKLQRKCVTSLRNELKNYLCVQQKRDDIRIPNFSWQTLRLFVTQFKQFSDTLYNIGPYLPYLAYHFGSDIFYEIFLHTYLNQDLSIMLRICTRIALLVQCFIKSSIQIFYNLLYRQVNSITAPLKIIWFYSLFSFA